MEKKKPVFLEEIEALEKRPEIIEKEAKISFDKKQFLLRIPKEVANVLQIEKGNFMKFKIVLPPPGEKGKPKVTMEIIKSEK